MRAGSATLRYPRAQEDAAAPLLGALRKGRRALALLPAREIAASLGEAAARLVRTLEDDVSAVAANAGLSQAAARAALVPMAESWTPSALVRMVREEFPVPQALDGFVPSGGRRIRASGPPLALLLGSGSVPGVTVTSLIRALLVKSAALVKPGAGDVALTVRFAELARAANPALAPAIAVQYWPGGHKDWDNWERTMFREAGQVVVYGDDATVESVRARTPASTILVEHRHRMGVAIVDPARAPGAARAAAKAVALFDQRGCVSAHIFFVVAGPGEAARWCAELAEELDKLVRALPPAEPAAREASAVHQTRGRLALKAAAGEPVRVWSPGHLGWTVALAPVADFVPVGRRTAWVVPAADPQESLTNLATLPGRVLQTVGVAGLRPDEAFAEALFGLGVARIAPLNRMPFPAAEWLHDGKRPLGELVRWAEAWRLDDAGPGSPSS